LLFFKPLIISFKKNHSDGFSFVELIIVAALMLFLLSLVFPLLFSLRAELALGQTVRQVKTDLLAGLIYGTSGKSFAALESGDLLDPQGIPSHYGFHFKKVDPPQILSSYRYMEFRNEPREKEWTPLYEIQKEWTPGISLKSMVLKNDSETDGESFASLWVVFVPPFSKILFIPGEAMQPLEDLATSPLYRQMGLEFAYKDHPQSTWIWLDSHKRLRVE